MMTAKYNGSGFTLIELSIVLVIINLIVGSVSVGRDLIEASQMRSGLRQIEEYKTAYNTFRLKYNCIPGDCAIATQFFGGTSQPAQVTNGSGDSVIDGSIDWNMRAWGHAEMYYVFDHLAAAGLINFPQYDETDSTTRTESGTGYPVAKFAARGNPQTAGVEPRSSSRSGILIGNQLPVGYIRGGNVMHIGICKFSNWGGTWIAGECGINPWEASFVDSKIDDGIPTSGKVMLIPFTAYIEPTNNYWYGPPQCSSTTLDYVTGAALTPGVYYTESTLPDPNLRRTCRLQVSIE